MARPKKTGVTEKEAKAFEAFNEIYEEKLPGRIDLLQATVCALLNRVKRIDEQSARQIAVFVQVLAARGAYWERHRLNPIDGKEATREWSDYQDLLCEIALGERTKQSHCRETIVDQAMFLDQFLEQHSDFSKCRNPVTRLAWLSEHGPAIHDLLSIFPCFCTYDDELVDGVQPKWLRSFLRNGASSPGKLRNVLLALMHGTKDTQIIQIRKHPSSFTSHSLLFRPISSARAFPDFRPE